MNQLLITIHGTQEDPSGERETISLTTLGTAQQQGDTLTLTYDESVATGLDHTTTRFILSPDQTILERSGDVASQMVFSLSHRRHLSLYNTPYGTMTITVHTRKLRSDMSVQGGTLDIEYDLEINQELVGRNIFHITAKPQP